MVFIQEGVCRTPGNQEDVNAYRSELMGLYLILLILKIVCEEYPITDGKVMMACDNLGGLKKALQQ